MSMWQPFRDAFEESPFWFAFRTLLCLGWLGVFIFLRFSAIWPESCTLDSGRMWGIIEALKCSPSLLSWGTLGWLRFAFLWTPVLAILWVFLSHELNQRKGQK